jgi:hypothetical protein
VRPEKNGPPSVVKSTGFKPAYPALGQYAEGRAWRRQKGVKTMLNKTLVAALLAGVTGLAGQAFAQTTVTTDTYKVYALNDGTGVVRERVIETTPMTIERTIITGPAFHQPLHNTGVSRINGGVGGAIGGYYINGSTPSENRSLYIPWWVDAYQH